MKLKWWIFTFVVLIICGAYLVTHPGEGIRMETVEGYEEEDILGADSSGSFLSEVGTDLTHMNAIVRDFFTVLGGGESRFDSGLAVLTGNERIDADGMGHETERTADEAEERMPGPGTTVADAFQSKQDRNGVQPVSADIVLTEARVMQVIDGDTFYAAIGNSEINVRLIGVDAPESVHMDPSQNTVWGTYASDYTKGILLENMTVYLEYDEEPTDKYGRTLAYVWLVQDTSDTENMLNAILVRDGYAYDKVFQPNDKYAVVFEQLRIAAQNTGAGLWADEGFCSIMGGLGYEKNTD